MGFVFLWLVCGVVAAMIGSKKGAKAARDLSLGYY
jgi:hypothetical protein